MMPLIEKLVQYWAYPFVRYALVVGVLVASCASLLGITLVLRRFSFIGDGLSHVAFGAMSAASVLSLTNDMPLVMGVTVLCAILLLGTDRNRRIKGDAAMAMLSVGALAVGYLMMNVFSTSSNLTGDVCTTLFGSTSILTLTKTEVWMCAALSVAVVLLYCYFYHKIFAITFDETFASATGIKTKTYNLILAVVTAVIIVMAMNLVGSLLISALVTFPAMSAMRLFKSFRAVTVCAAVFSVCCAAFGILISILAGTPVGSTIVAAEILLFIFCSLLGRIGRRSPVKRQILYVLAAAIVLTHTACSGEGPMTLSHTTPPPASTALMEPQRENGGSDENEGSVPSPASDEALENSQDSSSTGSNPNRKEKDSSPGDPELNLARPSAPSVDVDLTTLSSTMVYAEVFNMMMSPDNYIGKIIRITGILIVYPDPETAEVHCGVVVQDATACCAQGFNLILPEGFSYPQDYPPSESEVTVVGEFQADRSQEDRGIIFLRLENVTFESVSHTP